MRPIDADALIKRMPSVMDMQDVYLPIHFKELLIDEAPTIDAAPVIHGKWVHYKDEHTCSKCGETVTGDWDEDYDYCPHCGARMVENG